MLLDDEARERVTTTRVGRGLYLLKYVSGSASGLSPLAMVCPLPSDESFIEVISAPGVVSGFLSQPGEALVVRAERAGELSIKLVRQSARASFDASFQLELVVPGGAAASSAGAPESILGDVSRQGLRVRGHVARRGDVEVSAAQWIAGPGAPAAIEGVEIGGALPAGLRIDIQPLVGAPRPRWLEWTPPGAFAGTRGRALPLAGLRLRLVGDAASQFVICADALFLGAAVVSKQGTEIELIGPGSADALVGLRLDIAPSPAARVAADARLAAVAGGGAVLQQRSQPRVRVFRAQSGA